MPEGQIKQKDAEGLVKLLHTGVNFTLKSDSVHNPTFTVSFPVDICLLVSVLVCLSVVAEVLKIVQRLKNSLNYLCKECSLHHYFRLNNCYLATSCLCYLLWVTSRYCSKHDNCCTVLTKSFLFKEKDKLNIVRSWRGKAFVRKCYS